MWFQYFVLILSVFTVGNGLLHDIFVLLKHKGGYDRNLLRLLMDGHILIISGLIYLAAWFQFSRDHGPALWLCIIASASLLVYAIMIYPFLKSFVTILLNAIMLVMAIIQLINPQIFKDL